MKGVRINVWKTQNDFECSGRGSGKGERNRHGLCKKTVWRENEACRKELGGGGILSLVGEN